MAIKIRKYTRQVLVYWEKLDKQDYSGRALFADPIELACRWEESLQEVLNTESRRVVSSAKVLLNVYVKTGSIVRLGTLADYKKLSCYPRVPTTKEGGFEIINVSNYVGRRGKILGWAAYL